MTMRFQLPETLVGEEVLLQWWYFTANSCTPEGYADYMARNNFPDSFWSPDTSTSIMTSVVRVFLVCDCLILTYCYRRAINLSNPITTCFVCGPINI